MGSLSKYEQETVINFNAGEQIATVYTRDKAVMRKFDALVIAFPEVYKLVGETDIDKTYSMPKSCVSYRKPRKLNDKYRELKRVQMKQYNTQSRDFALKNKSPCSACEFQAKQGISILGIKLLFFSV